MALPKFYIEKRKENKTDKTIILTGKHPITMFYSIGKERLQYFTGVRLEYQYYKAINPKNGELRANSKGEAYDLSDVGRLISDNAPYAVVIKANLKQLALDVQMIANAAKTNKISVTKEYLKLELDKIHKHKPDEPAAAPEYNFISFFERTIKDSELGIRVIPKGKNAGKQYTFNSIKNYRTTLSAITRYMKSGKIRVLGFRDIDKGFYDKFKAFCYGPIENKEVSTFAGYIKDIKTVMSEAKEAELHTSDGHKSTTFIMPAYESDTIYLNEEQIDLIASLDLSNQSAFVTHPIYDRDRSGKVKTDQKGNKLTKEEKISYRVLDKARDMFLIGSYTGLRFGNFSKLDLKSIEGDFIKLKQVKTGSRISIPIMQKLKPVLAKYPKELPSLSNQKFNEYIKMVAKLAGLVQLTTVKNFRGNVETETIEPLYKLISSHCCRRSYATNMFKDGFPTMLIMNSTGHKTESSFLKYIRASNEDMSIMMAEHMKRRNM